MTIAREARPFALAALAAGALLALWTPWAALPALVALAFTLWFFRDPARTPPADPGALVAPADGRILRADGMRISIFMNVFDVHVCRTPVGGTVGAVDHRPGRFLAAFRDEASEVNERAAITMDRPGGPVRFTLVAGLVARRIVTWVGPGASLAAGDRVGLIRFGSRVDVDLPAGTLPMVAVGDRVRAGETVLARLPG